MHRLLWAGTTGDPHAARVDTGLLRLSVDEVWAAVDQQLNLFSRVDETLSTATA
jgi:hypothetical protein